MPDCAWIEERLPWYAHGGLDADERRQVDGHLADCERCRTALADTREASALFATHLPVETVVAYGSGAAIDEVPRELIEAHLARCPVCREEVELVRAGSHEAPAVAGQAPPQPARLASPRSLAAWRGLALVASLVAVAGLGLWQSSLRVTPLPEGAVALLELRPMATATRAGDDERAAPFDRARSATLLLDTDRAESFDEVRVRALGSDGAPLWEVGDLAAIDTGIYALHLPRGTVPEGPVVLELVARRDGDWSTVARYRLEAAGSEISGAGR